MIRAITLFICAIFTISISFAQIDNDFCDSAIELVIDDDPLFQNPIDATASSFPSSGINCGDGGTEDIWYKARVPSLSLIHI